MNELHSFIIRAKKATWLGNAPRTASSRPESHDLVYEEGRFSYSDSYFGSTDFIGQEVVWHEGKAVWSMCYCGRIERDDLISSAEAADLVKKALSQTGSQGRLLDNCRLQDGDRHYEITSTGDISRFKGSETIHTSGILAYALDYFGGLIRE